MQNITLQNYKTFYSDFFFFFLTSQRIFFSCVKGQRNQVCPVNVVLNFKNLGKKVNPLSHVKYRILKSSLSASILKEIRM